MVDQKASSFIVLFGCGFTKYSYIGCLNKTIMHCFHFLYFVLKHRLYYLSVWVEYIDMWSCQWWRRVGGVQESHIFCSISLIFCSPLTRYTKIERKCFYLQLYVYLYAYLKNNVVLEIYDTMASAYIELFILIEFIIFSIRKLIWLKVFCGISFS